MSNPFEEFTFYQTVNLTNPHKDMRKILFKVRHYGEDHLSRDLIPTFIAVKISEILPKNDVAPMRKFCKILRDVQSENFVRFGMNLTWSANTDNVDMFYTIEANSTHHQDAIFSTKVLNSNEVEVKVTIPFGSRQSTLIRELSRQMTMVYAAPENTYDVDLAFETLGGIINNDHICDVLGELKENCYIFFIMSYDRRHYIPIPLYGISFADAQRRRYASDQTMNFIDQVISDVTPISIGRNETMKLLVSAIQSNEEGTTRSQAAMESYHLTELLFSYLLDPQNDKIPISGAYLFDLVEDENDLRLDIISVTKTSQSS